MGQNLAHPWFEGSLENQERFETIISELYSTHPSICSLFSVSISPVDDFIEEVISWTDPIAFLMPSYIPQIYPEFAAS